LFKKHATLNSFSWLQGNGNLWISRTMRFILPFLSSKKNKRREGGQLTEKRRGAANQEEKTLPSSKKPEIMHSSFFLISCSKNMQR